MKGLKSLKLCSIIMIIVCILGAGTCGLGVLSIRNEQTLKNAELQDANAEIATLQEGSKMIDSQKASYEESVKFVNDNKSSYETDKAVYDAAKKAYDEEVQKFDKEKSKLDKTAAELEQKQIEDASTNLDRTQESLGYYESLKASVDEYEAGQKAVQQAVANLNNKPAVKSKINTGLSPVDAAKEVLKEDTATTVKEFTLRFAFNFACAMLALLSIIAIIFGFSACKDPTVKNTGKCVAIGITYFVIAAAANVYGGISGYINYLLVFAAMVLEAVTAVIYLISAINLNKSAHSDDMSE